MPADDVQNMEDEIEGSGMDPEIKEPTTARPGILARVRKIYTYLKSSLLHL